MYTIYMSDLTAQIQNNPMLLIDKINNLGESDLPDNLPDLVNEINNLIPISDLGLVDSRGNTALIVACENGLSDIALALINTGRSKPEKVNSDGNTALIICCFSNMSDVALALINTGHSNPGHVDQPGEYTALIYACQSNLSNVALALINTGQSNHKQVDEHGKTALDYAKKNNMTEVIESIKNYRRIQQTQQEAINERVRQATQQHVEIDSPYEECIICGEILDNINGPGQSAKCNENCNDVVKICQNNHMIHRGCILNACNADRVDIASQMGFAEFRSLAEQERKNQCPICQVSLLVPCEEFKTISKVSETDLPKKAVGGRKNKTRRNIKTRRNKYSKKMLNTKKMKKSKKKYTRKCKHIRCQM